MGAGPALNVNASGGLAHLLLVPDSPRLRGLAEVLARALACPEDPAKRVCPWGMPPNSFHCMFLLNTTGPQCQVRAGLGA